MENLEDLIAVARSPETCLEQRHAAFGRLVEQFQEAAFRWAYSRLGESHLAQDVTQEAFLVAYQNLPQLRNAQSFPAWLRQIVFSQCSRVMRQNHLRTISLEMAGEVSLGELDPAQTVMERDLKESVLAAIEGLPLHEQTVTRLFYLRGYSLKEIARLLQVPLTTVKKRLQYARQRLKRGSLSAYGAIYRFSALDCVRNVGQVVWQITQLSRTALAPCYVVARQPLARRLNLRTRRIQRQHGSF